MVPLAARPAPTSIPATLRCPQLRAAAPRSTAMHGTPSCATSAQERTGHIMNSNIHAVVPLAARQAPKSVPATLSFCQLPSAARSGAQKHSHVMVPLAARQAPKSVPATLRCPQLRTAVPLAARQAPKSVPATLRCPQLRTAAPRSTAMLWYP